MAKIEKQKDLGLGEDQEFPIPASILNSASRPTSPVPKRNIKRRRKLPINRLHIKKITLPTPKQGLKIALIIASMAFLFLAFKIIYERLNNPRYPKGSLSVSCESPFGLIPRRYQFTSREDCQALRCTYNGITKEGDLYWCSQGIKENPIPCTNIKGGKYTCSAPVGGCEVLRLSSDNNCNSAVTYDCSGCDTEIADPPSRNLPSSDVQIKFPQPNLPKPPPLSIELP